MDGGRHARGRIGNKLSNSCPTFFRAAERSLYSTSQAVNQPKRASRKTREKSRIVDYFELHPGIPELQKRLPLVEEFAISWAQAGAAPSPA